MGNVNKLVMAEVLDVMKNGNTNERLNAFELGVQYADGSLWFMGNNLLDNLPCKRILEEAVENRDEIMAWGAGNFRNDWVGKNEDGSINPSVIVKLHTLMTDDEARQDHGEDQPDLPNVGHID